MTDQRKRLSKNASKILFEIICEDSFEGKSIKTILPATRRISKAREGLWEHIRSELTRRTEEEYDVGTVSAAWYYNLRKIGSCLDQIDVSGNDTVTLEKLRTLDRYVCTNLGDRLRGRGKDEKKESKEEEGDVKLTQAQMITLSRQSTMDATVNYSSLDHGALATIGKALALNNEAVKNERGSSNEEKDKKEDSQIETQSREDIPMEDIEMREDEGIENDLNNQLDSFDEHIMEPNNGNGLDVPFGVIDVRMDDSPLPSRYNTADTTMISRNNSTMSNSGYDADNEKGLIKRRRKELKRRGDREKEVKIEETEGDDQKKEEEEEKENDENEGGEDEEVMEDEEREEDGNGEDRSEKMKMMDNLKGMIENLRDHIVSLRIIGAIEAVDMETLADSFENAGKSISNNIDTH